jgi:phage gpG-like protein
MLQFVIKIPSQILARLSKMDEKVKPGLEVGLKQVMFLAERYAKTEGFGAGGAKKLRVRTGRLWNTIKGRSKGLVGTLSADTEYARIHEVGGEIVARKAAYLRFQVSGKWVAVKRVRIPERPYLRPAILDHLDEYKKILAKFVKQELTNE